MSEPSQKRKILARLNALRTKEARAAFTRCCGAVVWAEAMAARRPFASWERLEAASESLWPALTERDWKEAFAHHPQIGDLDALRAKFGATRQWVTGEQAGTAAASEQVLQALAEGNAAYRERFGYIFIVCATGKSADEMLALLRARLCNDPDTEIAAAAAEQQKITRLRLEKM